MTTYDKLLKSLNGRTTRKVANNTRATLHPDGTITLRLHNTDILTAKPDGSLTANSGGWKTSTTKSRLNEWLPVSIYQHRGQWLWSSGEPYTDGDVIGSDGKVKAQRQPDALKAENKAALAWLPRAVGANATSTSPPKAMTHRQSP